MIKNGYGFSVSYPPDTKYQHKLAAAETYAKDESIGFWSNDNCAGNVYTGTYLDPALSEPELVVEATPAAPSHPSYSCNCKKTCAQMSSCAEAQFQLNSCGCSAHDGDKDGIACDSDCQ